MSTLVFYIKVTTLGSY